MHRPDEATDIGKESAISVANSCLKWFGIHSSTYNPQILADT